MCLKVNTLGSYSIKYGQLTLQKVSISYTFMKTLLMYLIRNTDFFPEGGCEFYDTQQTFFPQSS